MRIDNPRGLRTGDHIHRSPRRGEQDRDVRAETSQLNCLADEGRVAEERVVPCPLEQQLAQLVVPQPSSGMRPVYPLRSGTEASQQLGEKESQLARLEADEDGQQTQDVSHQQG